MAVASARPATSETRRASFIRYSAEVERAGSGDGPQAGKRIGWRDEPHGARHWEMPGLSPLTDAGRKQAGKPATWAERSDQFNWLDGQEWCSNVNRNMLLWERVG